MAELGRSRRLAQGCCVRCCIAQCEINRVMWIPLRSSFEPEFRLLFRQRLPSRLILGSQMSSRKELAIWKSAPVLGFLACSSLPCATCDPEQPHRQLPALRRAGALGSGIALPPVLLRALQDDRPGRMGKRGISCGGQRRRRGSGREVRRIGARRTLSSAALRYCRLLLAKPHRPASCPAPWRRPARRSARRFPGRPAPSRPAQTPAERPRARAR